MKNVDDRRAEIIDKKTIRYECGKLRHSTSRTKCSSKMKKINNMMFRAMIVMEKSKPHGSTCVLNMS